MMKMRLICFAFLLNCLIYHTYTQHVICNSIGNFDTKTLIGAGQWQVDAGYACLTNPAANCTYYIGFCQPVSMCFNEYSACQYMSGASNMTVIAAVSHAIFSRNDSDPNVFYANFLKAPMQNISNTTECEPSLQIVFNCNPNAIWNTPLDDNITAIAPEPTDIYTDPNNTCSTIMTFDYAGACSNATTSTTGPTTTVVTTTSADTNSTTSTGITTSTTPRSTGNIAKPMFSIQCGLIFLMTFVF